MILYWSIKNSQGAGAKFQAFGNANNNILTYITRSRQYIATDDVMALHINHTLHHEMRLHIRTCTDMHCVYPSCVDNTHTKTRGCQNGTYRLIDDTTVQYNTQYSAIRGRFMSQTSSNFSSRQLRLSLLLLLDLLHLQLQLLPSCLDLFLSFGLLLGITCGYFLVPCYLWLICDTGMNSHKLSLSIDSRYEVHSLGIFSTRRTLLWWWQIIRCSILTGK